jgi:diguanylate cyclase
MVQPLDGQRNAIDGCRLAALVYLATGVLWACAHAAGLLGPAAEATFVVFGAGTVVATIVGVRVHGPSHRAPWALFSTALLLFLAGGVARAAVEQVGDLSADRVFAADLVTLGGYLALGGALLLLTRAGRERRSWSLDVFLDGFIVSMSALCVLWAFVLAPQLEQQQAGVAAKLVLGAYPAMSVFLVTVAVQLLFNATLRTSFAFVFTVASVGTILAGDVVYMLVELGWIQVDHHLVELPYVLAYVMFGATALHPTMSKIGSIGRARPAAPSRTRMAVIAAALLLPGLVAVTSGPLMPTNRVVLGVCMALLALTVAVRLWRSLNAHDRVLLRLRHQADHDPLTGLPNRSAIRRLLQAELETDNQQVSVLFLDLDRFKFINDSFGHTVGDRLLIAVGERLQVMIARWANGGIVSRAGGDEFVVVLCDLESDQLTAVAEAVRRTFSEPFDVHPYSLFTGASVGLASAQGGVSATADELIRNADAAMYEAKDHGRDGVAVFDASMVQRAQRRVSLEAELRGSLLRDELTLEYQPIVRLPDGQIEGLEALLRWTHPTLGRVAPSEFVPIAEETGLIVEVGAWVIDEACRTLADLRREIPLTADLHVSVNVCARQVQEGGLVGHIREALARHGLEGSALQVELTESAFLGDLEATVETLAQLRAISVPVSLDDFGTGYSSLAYLQRYRVDEVKIDQAFISQLNDGSAASAPLVAAIVAMARALGLSTVAEGVETVEQAQRLWELGCDSAQGYWFARPTPPARLPDVIRQLGRISKQHLGRPVDHPRSTGADSSVGSGTPHLELPARPPHSSRVPSGERFEEGQGRGQRDLPGEPGRA